MVIFNSYVKLPEGNSTIGMEVIINLYEIGSNMIENTLWRDLGVKFH